MANHSHNACILSTFFSPPPTHTSTHTHTHTLSLSLSLSLSLCLLCVCDVDGSRCTVSLDWCRPHDITIDQQPAILAADFWQPNPSDPVAFQQHPSANLNSGKPASIPPCHHLLLCIIVVPFSHPVDHLLPSTPTRTHAHTHTPHARTHIHTPHTHAQHTHTPHTHAQHTHTLPTNHIHTCLPLALHNPNQQWKRLAFKVW